MELEHASELSRALIHSQTSRYEVVHKRCGDTCNRTALTIHLRHFHRRDTKKSRLFGSEDGRREGCMWRTRHLFIERGGGWVVAKAALKIPRHERPSCSPDLNAIENVCRILKQVTKARSRFPTTVAEMRRSGTGCSLLMFDKYRPDAAEDRPAEGEEGACKLKFKRCI